jgi:hypothetical protein
MSKSITITLPNNVFNALDEKMGELEGKKVSGMTVSKSKYVSDAIEKQLRKDGVEIEEVALFPGSEQVEKPVKKNRLPIAIVTES